MLRKERGSIFVMVAIILFGIIAFLALAIDASIALASRTHLQQMARQIGFTAAEVATSPGKTFADAHARAAVVLSNNMTRWSMAGRRGGGVNTLGILDDDGVTLTPATADSGWIQNGNWYFEESLPDSATCGVAANFKPCFIPIDPTDQGNAVRVELHLAPGGLLKTIFGGSLFMNQPEMGVTGSATVALVPQYLLHLIDVSGSVVKLSHLGPDPLNPDPKKKYTYNFNVPADVTNFNLIAPTRGLDTSDANFYQDDYFDTNSFTVPGAASARFKIDTRRAPQPLNNILLGIKQAAEFLNGRRVSADKFAAFGFDSIGVGGAGIYTRGTYREPSTGVYLHTMLPPDLSDSVFEGMIDGINHSGMTMDGAFRPGIPITDAARYERMLYPRNIGATDLQVGVGISMAQMEDAATFKTARRKMTFFSDGGSNCIPTACKPPCIDAGNPPDVACQNCLRHEVTDPNDSTQIQGFINSLVQARTCKLNDPKYLVASTDEFVRLFDNETSGTSSYDPMIDREVKLNFFMNGLLFGAHRIFYKSPSGTGCMSEAEVYAAGYPITDSGSGSYPGVLSFYPSKIAQVAVSTGGRFAAILEPCPSDITADLNTACTNSSAVAPTPVDLETDLVPVNAAVAPFVSGTRLFCDPKGRTQAVQYSEEMEAALGGDIAFLATQ